MLIIASVFFYSIFPAHLGIFVPYAFSADFSLMWEWGGDKCFDVFTGSIQGTPSNTSYPWLGEDSAHYDDQAAVTDYSRYKF